MPTILHKPCTKMYLLFYLALFYIVEMNKVIDEGFYGSHSLKNGYDATVS